MKRAEHDQRIALVLHGHRSKERGKGKWGKGKWERIKDKGKRIKDETEQEESMFSRFSTFIPYPFSFIPFPHFAVSPCLTELLHPGSVNSATTGAWSDSGNFSSVAKAAD